MSASICEIGASDEPIHTILVVDDEVLIRMALTEYLREAGFRVFEAVNVAEAKAVLSIDTPVDLVFTDIRMPGGEDGLALANWVRQHRKETVVLLTSGFANAPNGQLAGFMMMPKPYELSAVLQRMRTLLGQARSAGSAGPG
jgi:DNA-binding response OmpR family regulator